MKYILNEEEYNELKTKAALFDKQEKGHVTTHYSHVHQCMETKVMSGDEAIDHLNEVLISKQRSIKHLQKRFDLLEKQITDARLFELLCGKRPSRWTV